MRTLLFYFDSFFQRQTFPCNFNSYEVTKDGRITKDEFFNFTDMHGNDVEQSKLAFNTLDSNGA